MGIADKLERLLDGKIQAEVARKAGISPTVLSTYLHRKSMPRANIAFKLAKALEVSVEWLLDDTTEWPPDLGSDGDVGLATTEDLMAELARRYRLFLLSNKAMFESACRDFDWKEDVKKIAELDLEKRRYSRAEIGFVNTVESLMANPPVRYNLPRFIESNHSKLPGRELPFSEVDPQVILNEIRDFKSRNPWFPCAVEMEKLQMAFDNSQITKKDFEQRHGELRRKIQLLLDNEGSDQ